MSSQDIPPHLIFINMNTGKNKNSDAEQRKRTIKNVLNYESPTLVFVEEFEWVGLHRGYAFNRLGIELDIPTHYKYVGNTDAGFIYDSRVMDCERLDLKSSVSRSYRLFIAHLHSTNFDRRRLCICKLKSKGPPEFELLCVSWHGPHNRFTVENKKSHLLSMLRFLLKVKVECGNLPLLLGGDFNLRSDEVDMVCSEVVDIFTEIVYELHLGDRIDPYMSYFNVVSSRPCKSDAFDNSILNIASPNHGIEAHSDFSDIMMWVHSSDFPKKFNVSPSELIPCDYFDHDVSMMKVQVRTPVEDFKQRYIICGSSVTKPLERETDYFTCHLDIRRTEEDTDIQMISASWHGGYDEYSDEAKEESLRATIDFLLREVQKHVAENSETYDPKLEGDVKLKVDWLLKDEPTMENIHSCRNTLDTWTLSNNRSLLEIKLENQRFMKWENEKHHLQRMSTPHQCPRYLFPSYQPLIRGPSFHRSTEPLYLQHYCPPHYCPRPLRPPDEGTVPNGNPVDIHLDIVNLDLWCEENYAEKYICTLNGYVKKCVYLQLKSPE